MTNQKNDESEKGNPKKEKYEKETIEKGTI